MTRSTGRIGGGSADVLIYRYNKRGTIEVLTGIRQHRPWKNCVTVPFGGHIEPSDDTVAFAARREVREEIGVIIFLEFFVGVYGPARNHYGFDGRRANLIKKDRSSVNHAFAGLAPEGIVRHLKDSAEQRYLRFVQPEELAGKSLAFDHALVLADFLDAIRDGSAKGWRRSALKLISGYLT